MVGQRLLASLVDAGRPSIVLSDLFFMRTLVKQITAASETNSAA
jgi:hypothetical protein